MYKRILVPTDGSSGMIRVFEHASRLAREHDAEIHVIYVVDTISFVNMSAETSWESVTHTLRNEGSEAVSSAREHFGDRALVTAIVEGRPSREIRKYAEREACDLIVMGTNGRSGLNRLLLGSVAERVVRTSSVPVLTVNVATPRQPLLDEDEELDITAVDPGNATVLE